MADIFSFSRFHCFNRPSRSSCFFYTWWNPLCSSIWSSEKKGGGMEARERARAKKILFCFVHLSGRWQNNFHHFSSPPTIDNPAVTLTCCCCCCKLLFCVLSHLLMLHITFLCTTSVVYLSSTLRVHGRVDIVQLVEVLSYNLCMIWI